MTRSTKIILGITLVILLGLAAWLIFGGKDKEENVSGGFFGSLFGGGVSGPIGPTTPGGNGSQPGEFDPAPDEKARLVQLSINTETGKPEPVIAPVYDNSLEKVKYFKRGTGKIFTSPADGGEEKQISSYTIQDIFDAKWSYDASYAVAYVDLNGALKHSWIRITGTSTVDTGQFAMDMRSLDFSPDSNKIAYTTGSNGAYSVVISSPDGSNKKTVLTSPVGDYDLRWIENSRLELKTRTSAIVPSILRIIGTFGAQDSGVIMEESGLDTLWSQDASRFIYSTTGRRGKNFTLRAVNSSDIGNPVALPFRTLPEKCVWSKADTAVVFCAVPKSPEKALLPDDWWQGKIQFNDEIRKYDLSTGTGEIILSASAFDITNMLLTPAEDYLIFMNKKDSMLWSYRISNEEANPEEEPSNEDSEKNSSGEQTDNQSSI